MKTQIIHLESDDDLSSILDKLAWVKAPRLLLVLPRSAEMRLDRLDLKLIHRASKQKGFDMGLVTRSPHFLDMARETGLLVFNSIRSGQAERWEAEEGGPLRVKQRIDPSQVRAMKGKNHPDGRNWLQIGWVKTGFFTLGVFAIFSIILVIVPSAIVNIEVPRGTLEIPMDVIASEEISQVNLAGKIPMQALQVEVEGSTIVSITTKAKIADGTAEGMLIFTNLTEQAVKILKGSIATRSGEQGIRYEVTREGEIPGGVGMALELPAAALVAGEIGNCEANTINAVVGDLGLKVQVTNPNPMGGGSSKEAIVPSSEDRQLLFEVLEDELKKQANGMAREQLGKEALVLDGVETFEPIGIEFVPAENQVGNQLSLNLKLNYEIRYVLVEDISKLAKPVFDGMMKAGFESVSDLYSIKFLEIPTEIKPGEVYFRINYIGKVKPVIDLNQLAIGLKGMGVEKVEEYLSEEYQQPVEAVFKMFPSWWRWMPLSPVRITLMDE